MAATTLSGLLQCNFLTMDSPMQIHFEQLCKTKLPKKRKRDPGFVGDTIPSAGNNTGRKYLLGINWACSTNIYWMLVGAWWAAVHGVARVGHD